MEDNLEIYFCEICNESIPANELAAKSALSIKGKVIGGCCLSEIQPAQTRVVAGTSPLGLTAVGAIVLAAVAAATLFLDANLHDISSDLRSQMGSVKVSVASQGEMWARLETRLDKTLQQGALSPIETKVGNLGSSVAEVEKRLTSRLEGLGLRLNVFDEHYKSLADGQGSVQRDIKDVQIEVVRLGRELAAAAATPRGAPVRIEDPATPAVVSKPADASSGDEPAPALPPKLAAEIPRLQDEDAGERFEAVDMLVQSKNAVVLPYLIGMLKDGDPFVRRLTAEGLANFKLAKSVEALLVTLADPEEIVRQTAYGSLKKLTGQKIAFDPRGSSSARSSAQRRWKDWWAKNRAKF